MINQDSTKMIEKVVRNLASLKLRSCGIAVSGGSDSIALFHIMTEWESENKPEILVASVDHGLRSQSKAEVEFVKKSTATTYIKIRETYIRWKII